MQKIQTVSSSKNLLFLIQSKRLRRFRTSTKAAIKIDFTASFDKILNYNYIDFPPAARWIVWIIFTAGGFFGLGIHGYYSIDLSKKQRLASKNNYLSKLHLKKDSWFFYGVLMTRKLNFLNSTITLRNVFYNEIMEKTFPIFSIWNSLLGALPALSIQHFLSPYLRNKRYKKKFFYLRNYPRAVSRIVLIA